MYILQQLAAHQMKSLNQGSRVLICNKTTPTRHSRLKMMTSNSIPSIQNFRKCYEGGLIFMRYMCQRALKAVQILQQRRKWLTHKQSDTLTKDWGLFKVRNKLCHFEIRESEREREMGPWPYPKFQLLLLHTKEIHKSFR